MVSFHRMGDSRLYRSDGNVGDQGWWVVIGPDAKAPASNAPITLADALASDKLKASFVYTPTPPDTAHPKALVDFVDAVNRRLFAGRIMLFLAGASDADIAKLDAKTYPKRFGLAQSNDEITVQQPPKAADLGLTGAHAYIGLDIASGSTIKVNHAGDALEFSSDGDSPPFSLDGQFAPTTTPATGTSSVSFAGDAIGCFRFSLLLERDSLYHDCNWGFQLLLPNPDYKAKAAAEAYETLTAWLPLAAPDQPSATDYLGFSAQINVINPNNQAAASTTRFWFTGKNADGTDTVLVSCYRTNFGKTVILAPVADSGGGRPANVVINPGYLQSEHQNGFRFSPVGDFTMAVDGAEYEPHRLMCGMSGTETIAFLPKVGAKDGNRLRFDEGGSAYVKQFPLPESSPIAAPVDPKEPLLKPTYLTSWASIVPVSTNTGEAHYTAAPKGADPFGHDDVIAPAVPGLLGFKDPGLAVPEDLSFPLLPYADTRAGDGVQEASAAEISSLERLVVSPSRRGVLTPKAKTSPSARASLFPDQGEGSAPFNTTTPTGFIAEVDDGGRFGKLQLAQMMAPGTNEVVRQMGFTDLARDLQAAFQTSNLFLVAANGNELGAPKDGIFMSTAGATGADFYNVMNIGQWLFQANVGERQSFGDYRNVMIVKGIKGKLTELASSAEKWTMKDTFAAPTDTRGGTPDLNQLVALSTWMDQYFKDALKQQDNPYFQNFCRIITDENWQGILLLRVDIKTLPKDLAGLTAGVSDPDLFNAHHIGIELSQVSGTEIKQVDASSMFGLIYYVDPVYKDSGETGEPIPPSDLSADYDFTLLTLKALFQNSAIKKFDSLAEVVLNKLFGAEVKQMTKGGNIYNAILLSGAFQKNGDVAVYSLSTKSTNGFLMDNAVLRQVVINSAEMSTRNVPKNGGDTVSWIAMAGLIDFALVENFDLFSFGSDNTNDLTKEGLAFNNLGLQITQQGGSSTLALVENEISFNAQASTVRRYSLYENFQLEIEALVAGDESANPESLGFIKVGTQTDGGSFLGVGGGSWHGIRYKLNLGTPGALASKINLNSSLLIAWSDGPPNEGSSAFNAMVGIELPGGGSGGELFSIQTVIKLSVGAILLYFNKEKHAFLLLMNEIALKLLGLKKIPPNGSTAFYLFGDGEAHSSSGLAWLAIYNQDKNQKQADTKRIE